MTSRKAFALAFSDRDSGLWNSAITSSSRGSSGSVRNSLASWSSGVLSCWKHLVRTLTRSFSAMVTTTVARFMVTDICFLVTNCVSTLWFSRLAFSGRVVDSFRPWVWTPMNAVLIAYRHGFMAMNRTTRMNSISVITVL